MQLASLCRQLAREASEREAEQASNRREVDQKIGEIEWHRLPTMEDRERYVGNFNERALQNNWERIEAWCDAKMAFRRTRAACRDVVLLSRQVETACLTR